MKKEGFKGKTGKKIKRSEAIEEILKMLEEYIDTTGAILDDYLADDGLITELGEADKNLREKIESMQIENDFDSIVTQLEKIQKKSPDDIEGEKLIPFCSKGDLENWALDEDYCLVRVADINKRSLLEEFVTTHIHPFYNDQQENLIV